MMSISETGSEASLRPVGGVSTLPATSSNTSVDDLIAMAIQREVPVETLERLLAMRGQLRAERAREAYFEALSHFQAECPVIRKDRQAGGSGGGYGYRYAPLETIVAAIAPLMRECGLSFRHNTVFETSPPAMVVKCTITHLGGHEETSEFRTPIDSGGSMNAMQRSASAQTYGKRYSLCNALGIVPGGEDDDAHGAGGRVPATPSPHRPATGNQAQPPNPTQPRPLGRNLVRIPSRGAQGSEEGTGGGTSVEPIAETPAPPEAADPVLADLRQRLIESMMRFLRLREVYAEWTAADLWDKAESTLGPWCNMGFGKDLLELNQPELERAVARMNETIQERTGSGVG
jgi:ERF superfamily protein